MHFGKQTNKQNKQTKKQTKKQTNTQAHKWLCLVVTWALKSSRTFQGHNVRTYVHYNTQAIGEVFGHCNIHLEQSTAGLSGWSLSH